MDDDDDYRPRKKKKTGFWTMQRVFVVVVFLAGFLVGVFVANQFIDPVLGSGISSENAGLVLKNQQLDSLNDEYYSCLQTFGIDPKTCIKQ